MNGGLVLGIFCEDEQDELERRTRAAASAERIDLDSLDKLHVLSRDGLDNLLCTFVNEHIVMTEFYRELEATVAAMHPRLTILDTAADIYGGDFYSTTQVRQFIKVCLGGLCVRYGTAVLLLAHPSVRGTKEGDLTFGSVAWNNSVRSRISIRRPINPEMDPEELADKRILQHNKSNYGPAGRKLADLTYSRGGFVPDHEPIDERLSPKQHRRKGQTTLQIAIMEAMNKAGKGGAVVKMGDLIKLLRDAGALEAPKGGQEDELYEKQRKPVQRALDELIGEGLIRKSDVPRGYRLAPDLGPEEEPAV
jgi:RecA-family ATPase